VAARFGDPRRTEPLSAWGTSRGQAVDRWYIERFLRQHAAAVSGRVLEVKLDQYATRFGAQEVEVVDIDSANPHATVVGDLCDPGTLQSGRYDAAVVTQTLQFVADPRAAVRNLVTSLRPGGALLCTVPCLSRTCGPNDFWRWTPAGFALLLRSAAPGAEQEVTGLGNGLAARAFLFGLAAQDLPAAALEVQDDNYPLIVSAAIRASS
jgi:SAM-dependent methyltransferase